MKLTLADCIALLRERIQALEYLNSDRTTEFWESMVELTTEGLERAKEQQVLIDKQMASQRKAAKNV